MGGAGLASKKDPPLRADLEEACRACAGGEVRLENGDGLACCCGAEEVKDSELNASFSPPNDWLLGCDACGCIGDVSGGDCIPMPANAFMLD